MCEREWLYICEREKENASVPSGKHYLTGSGYCKLFTKKKLDYSVTAYQKVLREILREIEKTRDK